MSSMVQCPSQFCIIYSGVGSNADVCTQVLLFALVPMKSIAVIVASSTTFMPQETGNVTSPYTRLEVAGRKES
jgi:hypothetical protein